VTAAAFFLLSAGLIVGSAVNVLTHASPRSTVAGVVISLVSIAAMYALMRAKLSVGRRLGSDAIVADANCTKTCLYLSFILLAASLLYELTSLMWFDVLGSLGIAWFSFTEGREALEKARSGKAACGCSRA
jgi:divalent metal cation (Fe/Co/Zn/Cd) transporter